MFVVPGELKVFEELFVSLVNAFQDMVSPDSKSNSDTKAKASTFLTCITTFEFVFTLVVTRRVFDITLPATRLLQAKCNDILDELHLITALSNTFVSIRNSIDFYHNKWYEETQELANQTFITETKPRTCGRQKNR